MWFLYSLCSVLCWSGSDLFSKIGSRPEDTYSHWKMVMAVGTVMGLHAIVQLVLGVPFSLRDLWIYLPVSALYIISMIFGYVGLRYIELSISSPVCNASGALVMVLCFVFLHQRMHTIQLVGVLMVIAGVIGLAIVESREDQAARELRRRSQQVSYKESIKALLFPILYALLDALGTFADAYWFEHYIDETRGNLAYELTFLLLAVAAFVYVRLIRKQKLFPKREKPKLIAACFETAGQFTYALALGANAILAAPLIASYSVFSVLWGRLFLHEKLSNRHYAVVGLALTGILILGLFEG